MKSLRLLRLALVHLVFLGSSAQAHYDPNIGRWLSRDPIAENGGLNLYGFIGNNGINHIDILGLSLDEFNWEGPAKEVKGGGGSADATWDVTVSWKGGFNPRNFIEVKGSLKVDVVFDPTDPREALAHEMTHVDKWKEHWDYLRSEINWLERNWCSPCDELAVAFGNASSSYWKAQASVQQEEFDSAEYPKLGVSAGDLSKQERERQAEISKRDTAKQAYEQAKSKFKSAGCFKK